MNVQIFGTKKCNDTKKAERFFKDNSPGFTGKLLQDRFSFFLIRRKKSLESKTPGMQA